MLAGVAVQKSASLWPRVRCGLLNRSQAGSAPDIVARLMGQWLSERLGQQFFVENRPGAGTNIGTEAVVRAHLQTARKKQLLNLGRRAKGVRRRFALMLD